MTDRTPKEAGFYWARRNTCREFEPVQVREVGLPSPRVQILGLAMVFPLDAFTWGPRITLPDELEGGAHAPVKTKTIPWPPTPEMMLCLYVDEWPGDWERGKRLQMAWNNGEGVERVVPFSCESEVVAGQLERFIEAAERTFQSPEELEGVK